MADLLALALERQASDLHLKAGRPPALRVNGDLVLTEFGALGADEMGALLQEVLDDRLGRQFEATGSADFAWTLGSGDRFRINVYRERGQASLAARLVTRIIQDFAQLHLPEPVLRGVCEASQGLVIFAGITGCGKSTSIAACLNHINQGRRCHIVTIEDPIEFLFEDAQAFVNQREIGTDVPDFGAALKSLMREDPDVVLVGEMRDAETCTAVLRAAETGHLVFTTLHAPNAPGSVVRLLNFFPVGEHEVMRQTLAANLVAVVCQKLFSGCRPEAPRVPATEVMLSTPQVRELIRKGQADRLADVITAGEGQGLGMHDFTQDLTRLVRDEWIDPEDAYEGAPHPEALKMALKGIAFKQGTLQ
jgi:twitching motility protein PilT